MIARCQIFNSQEKYSIPSIRHFSIGIDILVLVFPTAIIIVTFNITS